jgi:hypothetical protein
MLPTASCSQGRAIAQAVSRWLPTAAARVRARIRSCGICGGQSGAGAGFLRVLRFPLPIFIPPISPQLPPSIIWGRCNRPVVAAVPSGLSLTPLTIIKKILFPNSRVGGPRFTVTFKTAVALISPVGDTEQRLHAYIDSSCLDGVPTLVKHHTRSQRRYLFQPMRLL